MTTTPHGLFPILATPFDSGGALDITSLRRLVEFQMSCGVAGVATFGLASEGFALTADERDSILDAIVEVTGRSLPLVAGVAATSTVTAVEQGLRTAERGADLLMVMPPFMVKPSGAQLVDFYGEVASAVGIPVMVQDAPASTGVNMPADLIGRLSTVEGVNSVKVEAPPTAPKVSAVCALVGPEFAVFGGQNAQFVLDEYLRGAVGTMPACEFSDVLQPILCDLQAGREEEARTAFTRLLPLLLYGLQTGLAWAIHKEVLVRRGLIETAVVRAPAQPIDDVTRSGLIAVMRQLRLAPVKVSHG